MCNFIKAKLAFEEVKGYTQGKAVCPRPRFAVTDYNADLAPAHGLTASEGTG